MMPTRYDKQSVGEPFRKVRKTMKSDKTRARDPPNRQILPARCSTEPVRAGTMEHRAGEGGEGAGPAREARGAWGLCDVRCGPGPGTDLSGAGVAGACVQTRDGGSGDT